MEYVDQRRRRPAYSIYCCKHSSAQAGLFFFKLITRPHYSEYTAGRLLSSFMMPRVVLICTNPPDR